jgi:hypothetical protein
VANILTDNGEDPAAYSLERQWDALVEATRQNASALAKRGRALKGAAACLERVSAEPDIQPSRTSISRC